MKTITITGEAKVLTEQDNKELVGGALSKLDGISDDACFSDYFHDRYGEDEGQESLIKAGVSGGYLVFVYDKELEKLFAETSYDCPRELTKEEQKVLVEYTQGQWSDGIGEGFEQREVDGVYISPWFHGQTAKVITKDSDTI
ncbi:MAG: hypothetical protein KJI69_05225 [Patescibacteria group bacterium]|nr:hypothetical protein [Patescibacteria group bacterium]